MKTISLITIVLFALISPIFAQGHTDSDPLPEVTSFCNTATIDQLIEVKGIGKVLAARIVAARSFKSVHDVLNVKGIGKGKLAAIVAHLDERAE